MIEIFTHHTTEYKNIESKQNAVIKRVLPLFIATLLAKEIKIDDAYLFPQIVRHHATNCIDGFLFSAMGNNILSGAKTAFNRVVKPYFSKDSNHRLAPILTLLLGQHGK